MKSLFNKIRYEVYLVSLLILLLGQGLEPPYLTVFWEHFIVIQNVLIGAFLFRASAKWLIIIVGCLSGILIAQCGLLYLSDTETTRFWMGVVFSSYFFIAAAKVFQDVLLTRKVGNEMIAAVFCGLIMLGFIGSFLFTLIEIASPNAYSNLGSGDIKYQNLTYFSFISLLTIGYGDIVPLSPMAKKMAVLMGLVGNFYFTFVTAVIIGKYVNQKNSGLEDP